MMISPNAERLSLRNGNAPIVKQSKRRSKKLRETFAASRFLVLSPVLYFS